MSNVIVDNEDDDHAAGDDIISYFGDDDNEYGYNCATSRTCCLHHMLITHASLQLLTSPFQMLALT